jgi:dihydrofolate synthase/folylpolyglutamate synthase
MTDSYGSCFSGSGHDAAQSYGQVERALLARWPEAKLDPTLDRVAALAGALGSPHRRYPVLHLTGTNGKTSTSRMIDALVRAMGLKTGRFTSPHVESMTERICLDGQPLSQEQFVHAYDRVVPLASLVEAENKHRLSFFEMLVAMAYTAFADAAVEVAVVEVGMGGSWDATNIVDGKVAVVGPIGVDHARYLGNTPQDIAIEKAGIIKPGATVVLAAQQPAVSEVLLRRAADVGAEAMRQDVDFGIAQRAHEEGGQTLRLRGLYAEYPDVFLPLHGAHQAQNAALALAAVEAFVGGRLDTEMVLEAFRGVTSPGRLEIVRRNPTVLLDAAHNPHGAAAVAAALDESFSFAPLVGVVAVMEDKDCEGLLAAFEPKLSHVVCTQNAAERAMPVRQLAEVARRVFGAARVFEAETVAAAIEAAATIAARDSGAGGVLVTGSVVTVGEARSVLTQW